MESEILMYVVAKAAEPTGTTVTMASGQGDVVSLRFAPSEHLSSLYEVGDQTIVTIQPVIHRVDSSPRVVPSEHPSQVSLQANTRS